MRTIIGIVLLLIVCLILLTVFSATPEITVPDSVKVIGQATPVTVTIADPHGVREANAYIEQEGQRYQLAHVQHSSRRFRWLHGSPDETLQFIAGTKSAPQLKDGGARLVVEAKSNDFRGKSVEASRD